MAKKSPILNEEKQIDNTKLIKDNFKEYENFKYFCGEEIYFSAEIDDGNQLISFVKKVVEIFPNKIIKVYAYYEILERLNFDESENKTKLEYKSSNIFRTLYAATISSSIIGILESNIIEKGEIYYPADPFAIEFSSVKVIVEPIRAETNFAVEERIPEMISGDKVCYELIPIKTLLVGAFYLKYGRYMTRNDKAKFPVKLLKLGYISWTDFLKTDLMEQIEIVNNTKVRKGSLFDIRVKFINIEDIHRQDFDYTNKTLYLTYKDGLQMLQPRRIANIDFHQRPIMQRKLYPLDNDILIFFDTEWGWDRVGEEKDINIGSIKFPHYLTYVILYGEDIVRLGPDNINYTKRSGYYKGERCMFDFMQMLEKIYVYRKRGKQYNVVCIAHNASIIENHFVLTCLTEALSARYENYEIKLSHVSGTKVHSFIWKDIMFLDSMLFVSGSLGNITKSICKKYKKIDISKDTLLNADWKNPTQELIDYAMNDALSLAEVWIRFNLALGEIMSTGYYSAYFSLTNFRSGASIMKWWLTDDVALDYPIKEEEDNFKDLAKNNNLAWDSIGMLSIRDIVFMGGRCECGYIGDSKLFIKNEILVKNKKLLNFKYNKNIINTAFCINIDITSSYPYCMTNKDIPGRVYKSGEYKSKEELLNIIKEAENNNKIVYLYGKVKYLKEENYPLLGIKIDNKLVFPNFMSGMYSVSFWDFEFRAIVDNISDEGCVGDYIVFNKYAGFKPKIKSLFESRQKNIKEGNEDMSFIYKILMNSGYGSLALKPNREFAYLVKGKRLNAILRNNSNGVIQDAPGGFKWVIVKKAVKTNSLLFSASYITSNARFNLWIEGKRLIREEGAVLIYSDTDSHKFVDCPSKENYYKKLYGESKELGKWRHEGTYDDWEIAALKVYRMGNIVKYKGVTGTKEQLTNEQGKIKRTLTTIVWTRGRDGVLRTKKVLKSMSFIYTKGDVLLGDKGKVSPLIY